jgi:hypothetical protein
MSLLSVNIAKLKRLSLREVRLPATERIVEAISPIKVDQATPEEPILIALAQRVIEGENSYSTEEIVARIKKATNVNQERAEQYFKQILQAGEVEATPGNRYYLTGSTPF